MFFRQLLDADLGCASYVLGDDGCAVVVDPGLAIDRAIDVAREEGAEIRAIVETHVHADHVSGRGLLAARTGARIHVPAAGGIDPAAGEPLAPGDLVWAGRVRVEAVAAPGHRPEHLAFLVSDTARGEEPCLLLSGDSLLVGDLARPDLAVDPCTGARQLHATLAALLGLPADLEVWPGHVGGSLCGGGRLSRRPSSTLGYERRVNPMLREPDAERFAERLIAELPVRPPTVEAVVRRNRSATPADAAVATAVGVAEAGELLAAGAVLVDGRAADAFDARHLLGAVNVPLRGSGVGTRAGWLLGAEQPLLVAGADAQASAELARRLAAVGLHVAGTVSLPALEGAGHLVATVPAVDVAELAAGRDTVTLVDIRDDREWQALHLPHALHLPMPRLLAGAPELPRVPLAVICASGVRAATAASVLRRLGHDARRVAGGGVAELARLGTVAAAA